MNDPRKLYDAALAQTGTIVAAVRADQLADPTPCTEYDVRALLSHIVGGLKRIAHVGDGGAAMEVPARVDGVADDGWPAAYAAAVDRAQRAWADDAKLDRMSSMPFGTVPGRVVIAVYTVEVVTHGWDLATATGQPTELDPAVVKPLLPAARQFIPAAARGEIPFGAVVEPPAGAGPYATLAAWLGRRP
jgi:uncharacterized protein (TIGR03086 family)